LVNIQDAINTLHACRDSGDGSTLPDLLLGLGASLMLHDEPVERFFDELLALLEDPKFLALEDSWHLAYLTNDEWDLLTAEQRERLPAILVTAFDKYGNWMGAFVSAGILGDHYADQQGFAALRDLSKTANLHAGALVPHGLVYLVRATTDERLRASAIELLRDLTRSASGEVRDEAIIGLRDLDIEI
jgi:hypothetical protein